MKKIASTIAAVFAASAFIAAPAMGTPTSLPSGDGLFAVDYDAHAGMPWKVTDPTTGASESLDPSYAGVVQAAWGGAYDPTTELVWVVVAVPGSARDLQSFDVSTGATTLLELTGDIDTDNDRAWQVAIDRSGNSWVLSNFNNKLYTVDLDTGVTTRVSDAQVTPDWGFLSFDPHTNDVVYVDVDGSDTYVVSTLNTTTLALTPRFSFAKSSIPRVATPRLDRQSGNTPDSLAIDSAGNFWWQMDNGFDSDIAVYSPATDSWTTNGYLFDVAHAVYPADYYFGTSAFYSSAYVIAYDLPPAEPNTPTELASTGVDAGVTLGAMAFGIVTVAAGVAIRRRRA